MAITTWGTVGDREAEIADLHGARAKLRHSQVRRTEHEVPRAFSAAPFTIRELRHLASQTYASPVISLYLNFVPERLLRERPVYLSVFNSLRHAALEASRTLIDSLPAGARGRFTEDMQEVETFLGDFEPALGTRSLVLFKSGEQLSRAMAVPVRTADSLTIDIDPKVEPLEAVLEEHHRVLIAELAKDKARFFTYWMGLEKEVDSTRATWETRTIKSEDRLGKDQRRRQTHELWFLKSAAQLAARLFQERGCDQLALVGDTEVLAEFEDALPKTLRNQVLTRFNLTPEDQTIQRRTRVQAALDELREREETEALANLGLYEARGQLASGLEQVLEPTNLLVIRRLFVNEGLARPGFLCRDHNYLALEAGKCPFDGGDLLPVQNLVDELVEVARLQSADVMVIRRRPDLLEARGGVAAVTLPIHQRD
jgi:hypothetical protein